MLGGVVTRPDERRDARRGLLVTVIMAVGAAAWLTYVFYNGARFIDPSASRVLTQHQIVHGGAPSPYRYRVLVPFVMEPFVHSATAARPDGLDRAYGWYFFVCVASALLLVRTLLRTWYDEAAALAGVLAMAFTIGIGTTLPYFQPWSWLEVGLTTLAFIAAVRRWPLWAVALLAIVATLNRETGIMVSFILAGAAVSWRSGRVHVDRARMRAAAVALASWAVVYGALRVGRGSAHDAISLGDVWKMNTSGSGPWSSLRNVVLLLGPIAAVTAIGWSTRRVPAVVRGVIIVAVPPYLLSVAIWGVWAEVRLLVPLVPLLLPAALAAVTLPAAATSGERGESVFEQR